jgi:2-dehydro-3-deoxyphosphogluconate aldolase/(4S)-4-hydroxy-2-oxoglutarate aldolase
MQAQHDGYNELKFFPALQAGGVAMLKALYGPFSHIQFCPTGGITVQNAADFLALPNVACVGGSWLVPTEALAQADYRRIETLARQATQLAPSK